MDCNRAGILLIEIVTRPIRGAGERAPEVARACVTALRELVDADALDLIIEAVETGTSPDKARSWWVSYLTGKANEAGV